MEEEGSLFSTASSGFNLCSCCCCSVTQSCPALCDSMDCSTWGFLVFHCFPEFVQTHVHWVSDAIQLSHSLLLNHWCFPASGSYPMSQFSSGGQSIGVSAWVLPVNIQCFRIENDLISLQFKGLSRVFSNITIWKHQFSAFSLCYGPTLTSVHDYWKNHSFDYMDLCRQSHGSAF